MIAVPLSVVWLTSQVLYFRLHTLVALVVSLVLSFLCATAASRLWERRSKTAEVSFSELMLWSWYRLQKAEREIERGVSATQTAGSHEEQLQVLHELSDALESKDPYTRGHSKRVERHSFKTGVALGLSLEDVDMLRMSASLHDVGKIRVPNRVLHKPGALTEEERALIQEHPNLGADMVAGVGLEQVVDAVRHHHERWDGGGYPAGRAGADIPLFSRVIAVADSYDAIRSHRSYRRGSSRDEAVTVLTDESGKQFDPDVVYAFLTTLPARGRSVAAITSLATGPGALWRYLAQLFQRFGSAALAPAIGAAGASVIVASSSFLNPAAPAPVAAKGVVRAVASPGTSAALEDWEVRARYRAAAQADADADARLAAAQARADRRQAERRKQPQAARPKGAGTVVATAGGSGSTGTSPAAPQEPSTSKPAPTTNTGGAATGGTTTGTNTGSDGDPNAEGKDCAPKNNDSKGSALHCD